MAKKRREKEGLLSTIKSVLASERVRSASFFAGPFVAWKEVWRRAHVPRPKPLTASDATGLKSLKGCLRQEQYFRAEADCLAQQQDELMMRVAGRWSDLSKDEQKLHDELDDKQQCASRKAKEAREKVDRYLETVIPE